MSPVIRRVRPPNKLQDGAGERPEALSGLLRAAGLGDQEAFARFYDQTSGLVYGIIRKVVRDPAQSEEISQEVFVEIWRLAPRYDDAKGTVRSWVATIAHRRAVDRVRSVQASRSREEVAGRPHQSNHDPVIELVEDRLDVQRIRRALTALTEPQRQAIELAYYGGNTYREVATLLALPEGTVKTRIRDALIRLRDEMGVR